MNTKKLFYILAVIIAASFFSCRKVSGIVYRTNKTIYITGKEYLEKFEKNGIDNKQIFFVKSNQLSNPTFQYQFLKSFHSNTNYIYFGSTFYKNNIFYFKKISGQKYGCNEVLMSLDNEAEYPFNQDNDIQNLFDTYQFYNLNNQKLQFTQNKTVILICNFAEGNLFFKDIKQILDFIDTHKEFNYVILSTNFYDFEAQKFLN